MLFNEPKLLKLRHALQRQTVKRIVSVLFNEPKLLKSEARQVPDAPGRVSVLFNEPKLLKWNDQGWLSFRDDCFSALQRAEIAEIAWGRGRDGSRPSFSALQRAEIAVIRLDVCRIVRV